MSAVASSQRSIIVWAASIGCVLASFLAALGGDATFLGGLFAGVAAYLLERQTRHLEFRQNSRASAERFVWVLVGGGVVLGAGWLGYLLGMALAHAL